MVVRVRHTYFIFRMSSRKRVENVLEAARRRARVANERLSVLSRPIFREVALICHKQGLFGGTPSHDIATARHRVDIPNDIRARDVYAFCNGAFFESVGGYYPRLTLGIARYEVRFLRSPTPGYVSDLAHEIWEDTVRDVIIECLRERKLQRRAAAGLVFELFAEKMSLFELNVPSVSFGLDIRSEHPAMVKFMDDARAHPMRVVSPGELYTFFEHAITAFKETIAAVYTVEFTRGSAADPYEITVTKRTH